MHSIGELPPGEGFPPGGLGGFFKGFFFWFLGFGFWVFSLLDTIETTVGGKMGRNVVISRVQAFIRGGTLGIKK